MDRWVQPCSKWPACQPRACRAILSLCIGSWHAAEIENGLVLPFTFRLALDGAPVIAMERRALMRQMRPVVGHLCAKGRGGLCFSKEILRPDIRQPEHAANFLQLSLGKYSPKCPMLPRYQESLFPPKLDRTAPLALVQGQRGMQSDAAVTNLTTT